MNRTYRYSLILPGLALLLTAPGLAGQRQSTAQLTAVIPPVLSLQTLSTGGTTTRTARYTEVQSAVVLRVKANCRWRLLAVSEGEAPVLVRVTTASGSATAPNGYTAVPDGRKQLAFGDPSAAVDVVLDYRVPEGATPEPIGYELQAMD